MTFTLPEAEGELVIQGERDCQVVKPGPINKEKGGGGGESGTLPIIINKVS